MRANRPKGTGPERQLCRALRKAGYGGYRLNWSKAPGRPDIAYPGRRVAVFVNGCFWHRCPQCNLPLPKSHKGFWEQKFSLNVERDRRKTEALTACGWMVETVWECEIRERCDLVVARVVRLLESDVR